MKRLLALALLLSLGFLVTACQSNDCELDLLSVRNTRGDVLYYGMHRRAAERILGTAESNAGPIYNYDHGITILYRDDYAVLIRVSYAGWRTAHNVEVGVTTAAQLRELYAPYLHHYTLFLDYDRSPLLNSDAGFDYALSFSAAPTLPDNETVPFITFGDRIAVTLVR